MTATTMAGEADFLARVDLAERIGVLVERVERAHGEAPITDAALAGAPLVELFRDDDPEPSTPAAPTVVPYLPRPFDRAAHCQAIAAGGGLATVNRYGVAHMRTIGKAGARATIQAHGVGYRRGPIKKQG